MKKIKTSLFLSAVSIIFALLICEAVVRVSGLWVIVNFQERNYFTRQALPDIPYLLKSNLRTQWAGGEICSNNEESCENIVLHRIGMNSDGAKRQPKSVH